MSQEVKLHPKMGVKYDQNKPEMDLLPREALVEIAKVLSFGGKKYGRVNWRKGIAWSRLISATMRHLTSFNEGEDVDSETHISHVAHAACNLMFLLQFIKDNKELDDRYKGSNDQKQEQDRVRGITGSIEECALSNQELKKAVSAE